MSEIEELLEDFDELPDEVELESEVIESTEVPDGKQDKIETEKPTNDNYDFDKATIIIGLQILPITAEIERSVLITAGIKGEPPLISSTTLIELEQLEAFAQILEKLGDSQERCYRLDWSDKDVPFGQEWIAFQSPLDYTHCFFS
jgi:hypothetical protein